MKTKMRAFLDLSKDVLKRNLPISRLFENCQIFHTEFIQAIINNDEETFFRLLPSQTKKTLNHIYLYKLTKYDPFEQEYTVLQAVSIFMHALDTGNDKMVQALIDTGKINFSWKTDKGSDQFAYLLEKGKIEHIQKALPYVKNVAKINQYSYLEYLCERKTQDGEENKELEVAKWLIEKKVPLQHIGDKKIGNALDIAVSKCKAHLVSYLINTDIKRDAVKAQIKLFGKAIVQGHIFYPNEYEKTFNVIKSLVEAGVPYHEDMKTLAIYSDQQLITQLLSKVQAYLDIVEERGHLGHILENPSSLDTNKDIKTQPLTLKRNKI